MIGGDITCKSRSRTINAPSIVGATCVTRKGERDSSGWTCREEEDDPEMEDVVALVGSEEGSSVERGRDAFVRLSLEDIAAAGTGGGGNVLFAFEFEFEFVEGTTV
jgi:hypothetical protein